MRQRLRIGAIALTVTLPWIVAGKPNQASQLQGRNASGEARQPAGAAGNGHQRMLALLADIKRQSEETARYTGRGKVRVLRQMHEQVADQLGIRGRLELERRLALHELRLGNVEAAIGHLEQAHALLGESRRSFSRREAARTRLEIAVGYMRLGEIRNCVALHTSDSCILPIRAEGVHVDQAGSRKAIAVLTELLAEDPGYLSGRWLLNVAYMTVGGYPQEVPEAHLIPPDVFASDQPMPHFRDVAAERGVNTSSLAGGVVVDDFDGDAILDVVTSSSDPSASLRYFAGQDGGRFRERSREAGFDGLLGGFNLIQADYDNDGDTDILVLRGAWEKHRGQHPNSLLRNDGRATFTDVTFESGLGEIHYPTQTAAWADYDNDGDLDLYVGNEWFENFPAPSQLFRNDGDGTFTDVAAPAGVQNKRCAKGVTWADFNADRFPDLYVSNCRGRNRLYRNNQNGTFTDVALAAGVDQPWNSLTTWAWDYNNDGALDLFVAAYATKYAARLNDEPPDLDDVVASYLGLPHDAESARLYQGNGRGGFQDVTAAQGLTRVVQVLSGNFGDLDNDGYLDFYLGRGYPGYEALIPNLMYRNRPQKGFADVTTAGGFGHLQKGHGIAFADVDNDGDQDVFLQVGGLFPGDAFGDALFENPGADGNWLKVRLIGVRSNRSAIGARIRCEIDAGGQRRSIYRYVGSGGSFGANPLQQMIGVGEAEKVDVLEIFWPTSGWTQVLRNVPVNQTIEIVEERGLGTGG